MRRFLSFRDFDWALLGLLLLLCAVSVVEVTSSTVHTKFASFGTRQIFWVAAGVAAMFIFSKIDYHRVLDWAPWAYGAGLLALAAVLSPLGHNALGGRRWIKLGPMLVQPSEYVKLVLIMIVARYFANLGGRSVTWKEIFKAFTLVGIPMLLVMKQPDLGTMLCYTPILVAGLFLGGINLRQGLILLLTGVILVGGVWSSGKFLKSYQKDRLTSFINPGNDPRGKGYQVLQSEIAVGSGRHLGQRNGKGHANPGLFPAHSLYGLHLRRFQRGTRLCGRFFCPAAILPYIDAFDSKRSNSRRSARFTHYHGNRGCVDLSDCGQRRHGHRVYARHRNPFTFNELRWIFGAVYVPGAGCSDECPDAPVRQLTHLDLTGPRCRPASLALVPVRSNFKIVPGHKSRIFKHFAGMVPMDRAPAGLGL